MVKLPKRGTSFLKMKYRHYADINKIEKQTEEKGETPLEPWQVSIHASPVTAHFCSRPHHTWHPAARLSCAGPRQHFPTAIRERVTHPAALNALNSAKQVWASGARPCSTRCVTAQPARPSREARSTPLVGKASEGLDAVTARRDPHASLMPPPCPLFLEREGHRQLCALPVPGP